MNAGQHQAKCISTKLCWAHMLTKTVIQTMSKRQKEARYEEGRAYGQPSLPSLSHHLTIPTRFLPSPSSAHSPLFPLINASPKRFFSTPSTHSDVSSMAMFMYPSRQERVPR